jgi:hypothetical protein
MTRSAFIRSLSLLMSLAGLSARAVIFLSSGDPSHNTTDPGNGSGWQYEGQWSSFLGTAIAPNYFLTAKHVSGTVGDPFNYGGTTYTTTAKFNSPTSDLTLWQVGGTFSSYAPLYTGSDEVGKNLVVIGRGTQRGAEVNVPGASVSNLRGWLWGSGDAVQRWGQNTVIDTVDYGGSLGPMIVATFDRNNPLADVATLSSGDSGGGVFIQEGGIWKLAGINYGVETGFRTTAGGSTFNAAIFDAGGLFFDFQDGHGFQQVTDQTGDVSAGWVASRISANSSWINGIIAVPEPVNWPIVFAGALTLFGLVRQRSNRRPH